MNNLIFRQKYINKYTHLLLHNNLKNRSVVITYGEDQLVLEVDQDTKEASAYGDNHKKLFLPEYIYGLSVEKIADYIVVKADNNLFSVKWDGAEQIWVHVADSMQEKTSGLCGLFNK